MQLSASGRAEIPEHTLMSSTQSRSCSVWRAHGLPCIRQPHCNCMADQGRSSASGSSNKCRDQQGIQSSCNHFLVGHVSLTQPCEGLTLLANRFARFTTGPIASAVCCLLKVPSSGMISTVLRACSSSCLPLGGPALTAEEGTLQEPQQQAY